jgi:carboxymethylenebutenolidase
MEAARMIAESQLSITSADGQAFSAYVATPDSRPPFPAVVLIQEIFGINENMRWTAKRFATAGFLVIAPDLFWRTAPGIELDPTDTQQRARAMELNNAFNSQSGLSDCRQTVDQIRHFAACNGHVGAIGYCLGGRLAFLLAMQEGVDVGVCFYPVAIQAELKTLRASHVPILVHLGAEDVLCKPEAQQEIKEFVEGAKDNRVIIYEGVGHGFARLGRVGAAATAGESAELRSIEFLNRRLARIRKS